MGGYGGYFLSGIKSIRMQPLQQKWTNLISSFTQKEELIVSSWKLIEQHYTQKNRAYHNLTHIQAMLQEAEQHLTQLEDEEGLQLAIWFHDIIYNPLKKDNEQRSAEVARQLLHQTSLSPERIHRCYQQILLTIKHEPLPTSTSDGQFLIDFDLEVLSRDWEAYQLYSQQIRKEYWMYPGPLFRKGRKQAMERFLQRPAIYQTPFYRAKEAQARANIQREMEELL